MKIFFDTEFIDVEERGTEIHLLSLGAVREDGLCYYAQDIRAPVHLASEWVRCNVLPHLLLGVNSAMTQADMRLSFAEFAEGVTEFWAYYGTYDFMLLMQLYGGFQSLPAKWPKYFHDLETLKLLKGGWKPPTLAGMRPHHALDDARWLKLAHDGLRGGLL